MELLEESKKKKEGKGKKIVAISIVVLVIALIILITVIVAMQQAIDEQLKINVNGKKYKLPANLVITHDGTTYLSISVLASYTGYEFYNGEYKEYTEDREKGYVQCENEIATFSANSNAIYKTNAFNLQNLDYQALELPVVLQNDILYASIQDIGKILNSKVFFRQSDNTIIVQTMPYLISYYEKQVGQYGYDGLAEDFVTQKAVVYDMLVVKKEESYGVVSTQDFSRIIGTRYEKMVFIESTQEFVVTSGGKTGLLSKDGESKIGLRYDEIGLIDTRQRLYYAKNDNLMGVLNGNGRVIVYLEYNALGFNRENFPYENVKNNMYVYDNCIPIMKLEVRQTGTDKDGNPITVEIERWGLADKLGNILLNTEYDSLGYVETSTQDRSINNVATIPKISGIVIGKDGKYGVVSSIGKMIIPIEFDRIYSITNEGKDEFYLEQDGRTIRLDKYISDNKIVVENAEETEENNQSSTGGNTTITNGITNNTVNGINTNNSITGNTTTNNTASGNSGTENAVESNNGQQNTNTPNIQVNTVTTENGTITTVIM